MIAQNLIDEIAFERTFQDIQWGGPAHDDKHTAEEWFSYMHIRLITTIVVSLIRLDDIIWSSLQR
jgi:hypothetical protein